MCRDTKALDFVSIVECVLGESNFHKSVEQGNNVSDHSHNLDATHSD